MSHPKLEGWLTQQEAADILGVSRQAVSKWLKNPKTSPLQQTRSVGDGFVILVSTHEVEAERVRRTAASQA